MLNSLLNQKRKVYLVVLSILFSLNAFSQTRVTGKVTASDDNMPIIGASVQVKGGTAGTSTGPDGTFAINANTGDVLVIRYLGFIEREITVTSQTTYNISLSPSLNSLEEIVVTGYSSERKKDITGSVAVVNVDAMTSVPSGSTSQLLQGQASGVVVISGGQPGANASIFVRGVTSFGNTAPLVMIDGVQGGLNDISPNDIESVQVLKDAGAASIYGVRGANGVIVVTTKKGKSGTPRITYDTYYGQTTPPSGNVFNIMTPLEQAQVYSKINPDHPIYKGGTVPDFLYLGGYAAAGDPRVDPSRYVFDPSNPNNNYQIAQTNKAGTDWFHEVFKTAPQSSHALSASGGGENSTYLFSVNYLNQQGTLIETFLKRYATRVNTSFSLGKNKNIRIGENAYLFNRSAPGIPGGNQSEGNAISFTYRMQRLIPVRDIQGNYAGTRLGTGEMGNAQNPVALQENTRNNRNNDWNMLGNVFGEVDFLKDFTARTSFGGTLGNSYNVNFGFNPYFNREGFANPNGLGESASYFSQWTWTNTLNYAKIIGKHNFKVLGGSEAVNTFQRGVGGNANNLFSSDFDYLLLGNGTSNVTNFSFVGANNRLFSLFADFDYQFNDKYLLGATVRRDGSSVFGANRRFGVFPSFSAGWRISEEGFLKDVKWLDDMKIRGSWGKMGSFANVPGTNAFSLFNQGFRNSYYPITGGNTITQGFRQSNIGNPETGWEENVVSNVGIDVTMLGSKVNFTAEWYKKNINGLLFRDALPSTAGGASAPVVNLGDIQNSGFDFNLGYNNTIAENFRYNVGLNFTTYKNEVISVPGDFFESAGSRIGNLVRNQEGQPVSSFYGYQVNGLFRDPADVAGSPTQAGAAPGRFKYADINGDNAITPADRTFFGNPNPDFTYGLNLSASYKQFDFSTVLFGSQGNDAVNYVKYWTDFVGTFVGGKSKSLLTAWTPTNPTAPRDQWVASNPNATTPVAEAANNLSNSGAFNSYYLEDASFLKMRSLQLGYTINPTVLQRFGVQRLRAYVQGANLFTATKYSGIDPELVGSANPNGDVGSASFGIDYGNYPNNQRSFLFGLNLSF
ncbi:MAG: TonB-dependent receptor [Daejeonella sp.]|uniref:SusC/RagA family TonB-linked outer membrane protein n=1 Tax=Daejeonella sp. TaxID=2805397 RepID=UPI003C745DC5